MNDPSTLDPDQLREHNAWMRRLAERLVNGGEQADELVACADEQRFLLERVLALPEAYRAALLLRFYEGLPPRAVAQLTTPFEASERLFSARESVASVPPRPPSRRDAHSYPPPRRCCAAR